MYNQSRGAEKMAEVKIISIPTNQIITQKIRVKQILKISYRK